MRVPRHCFELTTLEATAKDFSRYASEVDDQSHHSFDTVVPRNALFSPMIQHAPSQACLAPGPVETNFSPADQPLELPTGPRC